MILPPLTDAQLERAARVLCARMGIDPDAVALRGSEVFGTTDRLHWQTATAKIRQTHDLLASIAAVDDGAWTHRAILPLLADHEDDLARMQALLTAAGHLDVPLPLVATAWRVWSQENQYTHWRSPDGFTDPELTEILVGLLDL